MEKRDSVNSINSLLFESQVPRISSDSRPLAFRLNFSTAQQSNVLHASTVVRPQDRAIGAYRCAGIRISKADAEKIL